MSTQEEPKREVIVEIRYSSYTPAQKRATQKYRNDNKDKVNEQRKKYYQTRKESDPAFLEYKRAKAKEYYVKAKLRAQTTITEIPQPDAPVNEVVGVLSAMSHPEGTRVEDIVKPIEDVVVPSDTPKPVTKKVLLTQKKKAVEL
jgi:hypothetical protein